TPQRTTRQRSLSDPLHSTYTTPNSSPMYSPRTERRMMNQSKADQRKHTIESNKKAAELAEEHQKFEARMKKTKFFDELLEMLTVEGYTLVEFLDYIFNPNNCLARDYRWSGFFQKKAAVLRILNYWCTSHYSKSVRVLLYDWAIALVGKIVQREAKKITDIGILRTMGKTINESFFLSYRLAAMAKTLRGLAPGMFSVMDKFSTTTRQLREMKPKSLDRKKLLQGSAALTLLKGFSEKNNYPAAVNGTYLMATGGQRQHFGVFRSLGIMPGYTTIIAPGDKVNTTEQTSPKRRRKVPGILRQLSEACRGTARGVAQVGLFGCVYDNINLMFRVAEQILGRKNAQENGTCAAIWPLFAAELEDMKLSEINDAILNAPPLEIKHIELTEEEHDLHNRCMIHTVQRIIVMFGGLGFERWKAELDASEPFTSDRIPTHKTDIHPLPAMEIDEAPIVGNVEVLETIYRELELVTESEEFTHYAKIICGDQLTIARQRSIVNIRLGHEDGADSWQHVALMPGLFHVKLADCNAFMEMHFGKPNAAQRSPGGLAFHNSVLDRTPILLTSLPSFRTCRDLIMTSLYARVLHCLLLVSGKASLEEYVATVDSFKTLTEHATQIYKTYTNTDFVQELREMRAPEEYRREAGHVPKGDMVLENAYLFMRDGLLTRLFADSIKSGDSGRVIMVLKLWTYSFRGNNRSKYAHEMLHLIHNLINVWPAKFRDIIIKNWLLNPTGKDNAFVEVDLVQEHLNFWIKVIYKADGDSHSWDWLAMVAPTVDVLRRLATSIHEEIGSRQGSKHSSPEISKDIKRLMMSIDDLDVYRYKEGRVLDADEKPVADAMSVGLAALSHGSAGNPLTDFNAQWATACARRRLVPISALLPFLKYDDPLADKRLGGNGHAAPPDDNDVRLSLSMFL
ncbi:uncharacterized protein STEHIDRAFT_57738, partial [Stereum hirsutum FP-91666 SS1]|uniref:uncharacterized protein n=1 Tax=Stereum hirsutum (strain FP-91666) TaxID=721885 RepID=UPI000440A377